MVTFFSTSAGVLSALFIAFVVAIQMLSFDQYRLVPPRIKRWFPWVMWYTGAAILVCLFMVLDADLGLPFKPWVAGPAVGLVTTSALVLVGLTPFIKTLLEGEAKLAELTRQLDEAKAENQQLTSALEEVVPEINDLLRRMRDLGAGRPEARPGSQQPIDPESPPESDAQGGDGDSA